MGAMPNQQDYLAFESGRLKSTQEVDFFQRLVDSGEISSLGARYQSRLKELVEAEEVFTDA